MSKYLIVIFSAIAVLLCGCDSRDSHAGKAISDPLIEIIDFSDLAALELDVPVDPDNFAEDSAEPETTAAESDVTETEALISETAVTDALTEQAVIDVPETTVPETSYAETVTKQPDETLKVSGVFAVINTSSGKFHLDPDCSGVRNMNAKNRLDRTFDSLDVMIAAGYTPCGICSKDDTAETKAVTTKKQTDALSHTGAAVLNTNSKKIHTDVNCSYALQIKESNRKDVVLDDVYLNELIAGGYTFCKGCS